MNSLSNQIEQASRERSEAWSSGDAVVVARLTAKLADLYEERRIERARLSGSLRNRSDVMRRARIETELERLMSEGD